VDGIRLEAVVGPPRDTLSITYQLRVLHTVAGLEPDSGGPSRTVPTLCDALAMAGSYVHLVVPAYNGSKEAAIQSKPKIANVSWVKGYAVREARLSVVPQFRTALTHVCHEQNVQLMHDHGLWLPVNHTSARVARTMHLPRVVSPRGMLEPWALSYRAWKKRVAWYLYQYRDLRAARLLHATGMQEAENIRRLELRQPIAVIPNGIELPPFKARSNRNTDSRTILFLGRIHPIKGLLNLVQAWRCVIRADWKLVIAGPDEDGHRWDVETAIRQAGLEQCVEFTGSVEGETKVALFRRADVFVLPSFSENFGVVVAEALASGVPVIATKGTPWEGLVAHRCGWWVDVGVEPLAAALREATALSDEERRAMGERGRRYAEQFGWPQIAEQMFSVYLWVLGRGPKPDCIFNE
jgi:glycosyltransferase involved in cell wall biosynthesis